MMVSGYTSRRKLSQVSNPDPDPDPKPRPRPQTLTSTLTLTLTLSPTLTLALVLTLMALTRMALTTSRRLISRHLAGRAALPLPAGVHARLHDVRDGGALGQARPRQRMPHTLELDPATTTH